MTSNPVSSNHSSSLCFCFLLDSGNKPIIVQFSNRQEIHTPATMAAAGGAAGGAAGAAAAAMDNGAVHSSLDTQQTANSILIVTVLNTRVAVTLDHIHQIFKPCGEVLKIITFHKNGVFKALVQLASVDAAVNARVTLEGKDIFQGCCHLRIGFSSLHELHVKTPGNNARGERIGHTTHAHIHIHFVCPCQPLTLK